MRGEAHHRGLKQVKGNVVKKKRENEKRKVATLTLEPEVYNFPRKSGK